MKTEITETNIARLVASHPEGVTCEERFDCGWMADMIEPSARLVTVARKHPSASIVVFGDETLGIEIEGRLWAIEQPHVMRGCKRTIPLGDWQWLHWASNHGFHDGSRMVSFGDNRNLRKVWTQP